jgi:hypothetical protein
MEVPPVLVGTAQVRDADWLPATATTLVGAPGTLKVVTGPLNAAGPVPFTLEAATEKVYVAPLASPATDAVVPVTVTTADAVAGNVVTK